MNRAKTGSHSPRAAALNFLFRATRKRNQFPYRLVWSKLYQWSRSWTFQTVTRIHGRNVAINANYTYPIYSRMFPGLNAPLIQLVQSVFTKKQSRLNFVDIGAAIGDTVLLVEANCPGAIQQYLCIDGDTEFFDYLRANLAHLPNCRCVHSQLAATSTQARSLVRIHGGTASAQGADNIAAVALDDLIRTANFGPIDVIKIDVDGFDGEVIAGGTSTFSRDRPAVVFEWHPILCRQTGNAFLTAFAALRSCGYDRLLWFTKYGAFSHFGSVSDTRSHELLAQYCFDQTSDSDWHYDVIAVPPWLESREQELADLAHARNRRSPW